MLEVSSANCCGCAVCEVACPRHAIRIETDVLGFPIAFLDRNLCIDCGLCERLCPFHNKGEKTVDGFPKAYAVNHVSPKEIMRSRSGGAFAALSKIILDEKGIVYGAGWSDNFQVVHKRAETYEERDVLRGSKYIQSLTVGVYKKVLSDLKQGQTVLFSGTPCQVSALLKFIPKTYLANLFTIDIICHGVASPAIWNEWISYVSKFEGKPLVSANFRNKEIFGWAGLHRESFTFNNGKIRTYPFTFYQPFLIRESCHSCPYASINRVSDITLGDFWGWERVVPDFPNSKEGVSLVLTNSIKGEDLLRKSRGQIVLRSVALSETLQPNLQHPTPDDPMRQQFANDYERRGFSYVRKRYWRVSMKEWLKFYVKRTLGR